MLRLPQLRPIALASLLGATALVGTGGHVFAQADTSVVAAPYAAAVGPDGTVIPAPADGTQVIVAENGGAESVIVIPTAANGPMALAEGSPGVTSDDPPLDNGFMTDSPISTIQPWATAPSDIADVTTSDSPPLDNPAPPGADYPNNPWR